jgi:hypothetical protein
LCAVWAPAKRSKANSIGFEWVFSWQMAWQIKKAYFGHHKNFGIQSTIYK